MIGVGCAPSFIILPDSRANLALQAVLIPLEHPFRFRSEQHHLLQQHVLRGVFSGSAECLFDGIKTGNINTAAAAASCRKFFDLTVRSIQLEHQVQEVLPTGIRFRLRNITSRRFL